jgi:alpha-N-arabinofuranosidase
VVRLLKSDARTDPAAPELRVEAPISGTRLRLRVRADGGRYRFSCAAGVEDFMPIGEVEDGSFLSTRYAGGFVGTYVGMYASSQGEPSSNHADFDWFAYATHDTDVADPFGG